MGASPATRMIGSDWVYSCLFSQSNVLRLLAQVYLVALRRLQRYPNYTRDVLWITNVIRIALSFPTKFNRRRVACHDDTTLNRGGDEIVGGARKPAILLHARAVTQPYALLCSRVRSLVRESVMRQGGLTVRCGGLIIAQAMYKEHTSRPRHEFRIFRPPVLSVSRTCGT